MLYQSHDTNPNGPAPVSAGSYGQVVNGQLVGPGGGISGHDAVSGFAAARRHAGAAHQRRVVEAARLYADCVNGREDPVFIREAMRPTHEVFVHYLREKYPALYYDAGGRTMGLRETMSVTDYQALYVDVLDRMYYGYYNTYPIVNKQLVRSHSLRDFRQVKRYLLDGAVSPLAAVTAFGGGDAAAPPGQKALLGPAPQNGATPSTPATSTAALTYSPELYQSMTAVNWRAFVNDDLGIFKDLSNRLAIQGNRGISKFITSLFFDVNGPNALLYTSGYGNLIAGNPVLGVQGLSDALKKLAGMKDSTGDPILITGRLKLVFGPALLVTANNLMNQLSVFLLNEGGGGGLDSGPAQFLQVNNWLIQNMDLVMDPYIPIVATSGTIGATAWALVVDPASQNRPCVEVGWLNGFETPQIFTKVPNTQRMGGGVDAMMGDFYTMDQDMKIITVMGGSAIDGRSTVASNGSGS